KYCELQHDVVMQALAYGLEVGSKRGFAVACAVVDSVGRTRGVLRHEEAGYMTSEFAEGKARLASSTKSSTQTTFDRLQKERPLYGTTLAALNGRFDWFLAEGGAPIDVPAGETTATIAA